MNISVEYALNIVQSEIENFIYRKMQESKVSAGLMEKILEGILCQIRKLKNQDLENLILELNRNLPEVCEEKIEKHTASIENLEVKKDGSLQSKTE